MALTTLLGLTLFAIGALGLFFLFQLKLSDEGFYIGLALSIFMLSVGSYLVYISVDMYTVLKKLFGLGLVYLGYWLTFEFADSLDIQREGENYISIIAGVISFIWGIYLLVF